jgi:acyl-CoA thioester hydrolase
MTGQPKLDLTNPALYRHWATDILRYCDTDAQGHINNIAFAVFCESGRTKLLLDVGDLLHGDDTFLAIAKLTLNFVAEVNWPGEVRTGTAVLALGRSSMTLVQGLFCGDKCFGTSESVIVLADAASRKSTPIPEVARQGLLKYEVARG